MKTPDGQRCPSSGASGCTSGRCTCGYCGSKVRNSLPCSSNIGCQSGYCYGLIKAGCRGRCKPKTSDGQRCPSSSASGCSSGRCTCGYCGIKMRDNYACSTNNDCQNGLCFGAITIGCRGRCKTPDGRRCPSGGARSCASSRCTCGYCGMRMKENLPCSTNGDCQSGMCFGQVIAGCRGRCKPKISDGQGCPSSGARGCSSGRCTCGYCGIKMRDNFACSQNDHCQSGHCFGLVITGCRGRCKPKTSDGQRCPSSSASGCSSGRCTCGYCGIKMRDNYACSTNNDCQNGLCFGAITIGCRGRCKTPDGRRCPSGGARSCASSRCTCGYCGNKVRNSLPCSSNIGCQSGYCYGLIKAGCRGRCRPKTPVKTPDGQKCPSNGAGGCTSGRCTCGYCGNKVKNSLPCSSNIGCQSGYCYGLIKAGCRGRCKPKTSDGQRCPSSSASGCSSGRCTCGYCGIKMRDNFACSTNNDCQNGLCYGAITIGCRGRCKTPDGRRCPSGGARSCASSRCTCGYCGNKVRNSLPCSSNIGCQSGYCYGLIKAGCRGRCRPKTPIKTPDGQKCPSNGAGGCTSGRCTCGYCGNKVKNSLPCSSNIGCQSGYCYGLIKAGCRGRCKPKTSDGQRCPSSSASGCSSGRCTCGYCGIKMRDNFACSTNNDCQNGLCYGAITIGCRGRCKTPDGRRCPSGGARSCASSRCTCGYCGNKVRNSLPCSSNIGCQSGYCYGLIKAGCRGRCRPKTPIKTPDGQKCPSNGAGGCTSGRCTCGYCGNKVRNTLPCSSDIGCQSGYCYGLIKAGCRGRCRPKTPIKTPDGQKCPSNGARGCTSGRCTCGYCGNKVRNTLPCSSDIGCQSGYCYGLIKAGCRGRCRPKTPIKTPDGQKCPSNGAGGCTSGRCTCGYCGNKVRNTLPCSSDIGCQSGYCYGLIKAGCRGRCRPKTPIKTPDGQKCPSNGAGGCTSGRCTCGYCGNKVRNTLPCSSNIGCQSGYCYGLIKAGCRGRCRPKTPIKTPDGQKCPSNGAGGCTSGRCTCGYCGNKVRNTLPCSSDIGCQSGYCYGLIKAGCRGRCRPKTPIKTPDGQKCPSNGARGCTSGRCTCGYCGNKVRNTLPCSSDIGCQSGYCYGLIKAGCRGRCRPKTPIKTPDGQKCPSNGAKGCTSGSCICGHCGTMMVDDLACSTNNECQSGLCFGAVIDGCRGRCRPNNSGNGNGQGGKHGRQISGAVMISQGYNYIILCLSLMFCLG